MDKIKCFLLGHINGIKQISYIDEFGKHYMSSCKRCGANIFYRNETEKDFRDLVNEAKLRKASNEINIDNKDVFLMFQQKWSSRYKGLELVVLDDKGSQAYRFTWRVLSPHLDEAYGRWESIAKKELESAYLNNMFIYKMEKLEAEFKACAIEHYLRGAISPTKELGRDNG